MSGVWKKSTAVVLSGICVSVLLTGCGGSSDEVPKLGGQEARSAFENSEVIHLTGDIDDVNTFSDVIADGNNVGEVKETGFFDNSISYLVDGEEQFSVAFCDFEEEDKLMETKDYPWSTTYTYYDADGNRLGYAQDRVLFDGDDDWYVMTFLDTEGNMKNYYIEPYDTRNHNWAREGAGVYNMDREKVGEIRMEITNSMTKSFSVDMELGDAAGELSEMDRVVLYWRCVIELNHKYEEDHKAY